MIKKWKMIQLTFNKNLHPVFLYTKLEIQQALSQKQFQNFYKDIK